MYFVKYRFYDCNEVFLLADDHIERNADGGTKSNISGENGTMSAIKIKYNVGDEKTRENSTSFKTVSD